MAEGEKSFGFAVSELLIDEEWGILVEVRLELFLGFLVYLLIFWLEFIIPGGESGFFNIFGITFLFNPEL